MRYSMSSLTPQRIGGCYDRVVDCVIFFSSGDLILVVLLLEQLIPMSTCRSLGRTSRICRPMARQCTHPAFAHRSIDLMLLGFFSS